jgi:hypothetical protein
MSGGQIVPVGDGDKRAGLTLALQSQIDQHASKYSDVEYSDTQDGGLAKESRGRKNNFSDDPSWVTDGIVGASIRAAPLRRSAVSRSVSQCATFNPQTPNPKPQTPNPKPQTPNPKP